nr:rRNA adenine N(6)-methyltransferase family protein [Pseudonocardia sp. EC080610-09]
MTTRRTRPTPLGRHEHGQNFLADPAVPAALAAVAAGWPPRPLLELGAGDGALTAALLDLGRPVTAVELDPYRASRLGERFGTAVDVRHGDLVREPLGRAVDVVSNVPYALTTPLLRRLLAAPRWGHALLLLQWEVARKRAAVGGTTALTARWWPWYEFRLHGRVPARSFRPVPSVDGGILEIARRDRPLVDGPAGDTSVSSTRCSAGAAAGSSTSSGGGTGGGSPATGPPRAGSAPARCPATWASPPGPTCTPVPATGPRRHATPGEPHAVLLTLRCAGGVRSVRLGPVERTELTRRRWLDHGRLSSHACR